MNIRKDWLFILMVRHVIPSESYRKTVEDFRTLETLHVLKSCFMYAKLLNVLKLRVCCVLSFILMMVHISVTFSFCVCVGMGSRRL